VEEDLFDGSQYVPVADVAVYVHLMGQ